MSKLSLRQNIKRLHTIVNLNETINGLQNQISNLTEMIVLLRKEKFSSSREKTPKQVEGHISLFNEAEIEADESAPEPVKKTWLLTQRC